MDKIARLKEILESSHRAVFFGGAGMSTESGIPDFRSAGGIYSETLHQEFSPEQMASHSFLMAHPEGSSTSIGGASSISMRRRTRGTTPSRSSSGADISQRL